MTIGRVFIQICSLRSISKKDIAGIGHAFTFWGFLVFLISYFVYVFIGDGFGLSEAIRDSSFSRYFSLIVDIAGVVVASAIIWAAIRRWVLRPVRLELEPRGQAVVILALIFSLMLLHFSTEAFRINAIGDAVTAWIPVGLVFAKFFNWLGLGRACRDFCTGLLGGFITLS